VAALDVTTLTLGPKERLWLDVLQGGVWPALALAQNGTLLYLPVESDRVLTWVDRQQRAMPAVAASGPWKNPRLSPDGRRVAVEVARDQTNPGIAVIDLDRGAVTDVVDGGQGPLWTRDGTRLAFNSLTDDSILSLQSDGSGTPEVLYRDSVGAACSWSPDGKVLAFEANVGDWAVWTVSKDGPDQKARQFAWGLCGNFSPDGRWIAYTAPGPAAFEVYVRAYPAADRRTLVSVGGGHDPVWSADGRELFYRQGDGLYAVPVTLSPTFSVGSPRLLFTGPYLDGYDVSRDGQRFLVVRVSDEERAPRRLHLVQNWLEEVKEKVPATR
jgi:Tol biopolymer transport system component